ncbi:OprO/OprP family phosphate-selective porin [Novosphingobium naphthalenivorans]|uniref:OprO/OprP family phosphate-selective porin n=1 Tax=Novosphingobium naphthalenivorans TaxID=273168 RepID=UPI000829D770|nr:porin [Novosphingobium naphthalenivorans]
MYRTLSGTAVTAALMQPVPAFAQSVPEAEAEAMRAEIRELRARLARLERTLGLAPDNAGTLPPVAAAAAQPAPLPPAAAAASPPETRIGWKGSPRFTEGDKAFKVKGRIQADANYVSAPKSFADEGLGFSNEMRRIRLGGEGSLGAGFGYKLELELSDNTVDLVDTFVTYERDAWLITLGNHNSFQSLDELTGDTSGSVMERAAFTDAFGFERRLGLSAQYQRGAMLAQLGIFTDDIGALANDSDGTSGGDENNSYGIDGRLVYAPKMDGIQLHFGASAHWRRMGRLADGTTRYRQRPYAHSTNTRLIGTPAMQVDQEAHYGLELAGIAGRWHGAAEVHALRAGRTGLPAVTFRGGYAELGYFLTKGDSRGYKAGIFSGKAPASPLGGGGIGSIQINFRYDYLDLDDKDISGGKQNGYIAALIWSPIQYLRFNLNYALLQYDGAKALPSGRAGYDAHVLGTRFELDF